jgi:hypothetical protein
MTAAGRADELGWLKHLRQVDLLAELFRRLPRGACEEDVHLISRIRSWSRDRIITELLDMSALEAGEAVTPPETVRWLVLAAADAGDGRYRAAACAWWAPGGGATYPPATEGHAA